MAGRRIIHINRDLILSSGRFIQMSSNEWCLYFVAMCLLVRSERGNALDECLTVGGEPMTVEELSRECGFRFVKTCQDALDSLMSPRRQLIDMVEIGGKRYLRVCRFRVNQDRIYDYKKRGKRSDSQISNTSRDRLDSTSTTSRDRLDIDSTTNQNCSNIDKKGVTKEKFGKSPIYRSSLSEKKSNFVTDTVPGKSAIEPNGERERCDQTLLSPEERIVAHEKLHGPLTPGARDALLSSLRASETDRLRRAAKAPKQAGNLGDAVVQHAADVAEDNVSISKAPTDCEAWSMTREEKQRLVDNCIALTGDTKSDGNWWRITHELCVTKRGFKKMLQILEQFEHDANTKDPRATPMLHKGRVLTARFNAVLGR